ncbi:hypothetical protein [Paraburkholderia phenoliruptrix]|uniref:hypothetical protein n=1 Tax=Paraburkholderia phenoliruptrix TaxID=252970 RepID=UPI0034CE1321
MIKPTVGRVVWYHPGADDRDGAMNQAPMNVLDLAQPFAAHVVFVHDDRTVNLIVTDHKGWQWVRESVQLLQDDDEPNVGEAYAAWMPYQKGQAEKVGGARRDARESAVERIGGGFKTVEDLVRAADVLARYIETGEMPAQHGEGVKA